MPIRTININSNVYIRLRGDKYGEIKQWILERAKSNINIPIYKTTIWEDGDEEEEDNPFA